MVEAKPEVLLLFYISTCHLASNCNTNRQVQAPIPGAILEDGDGIELVQKFDNKTGNWTEVAGMLIPRSGSAACVLNGYIYVVGGWHASTENTNKVERYDVTRNLWEFVACMTERRYRPGVATLGGKMYVLGGEEGWDR